MKYEQALAIVRRNTTKRALELDNLERFIDGTQYEGLPDWFDDSVPTWERAPCVVYTIGKTAVSSNVDLVLGEGRYPSITVADSDEDPLNKTIEKLVKDTRFKSHCRDVFASAQASRSGVGLFGVRGGKLFAESSRAKWCKPVLGNERECLSLEIKYPYIDEILVDGRWECQPMIYRRTIDAQQDITYLPGKAREDMVEPDWKPNSALTFTHGFGFCPVVWYPHMRGCSAVNIYDGIAIHETQLDEIRAHDMAISQRHRAALYLGDPQGIEIGVEPGTNPSSSGRAADMVPSTVLGGAPSAKNPVSGHYRQSVGGGQARKKGPGQWWQYESPDAKVSYLELSVNALEAIDKNAHDIRQKIAEALAVVNLDPENIKFAATTSGKALETLKQRQLDRCDQYRDDFGEGYLIPAIQMLLRIGTQTGLLKQNEPASEPTKAA